MKTTIQTPRHISDPMELREDFDFVDADCDGRINYFEFKNLLEDLEAQMTESEMRIGFRELDTNRDGYIDRIEFIEWWTR